MANWLLATLSEGPPTLVGIDHGFSFPLQYFEKHGIARGWQSFLDDFCAHWPTDDPNTYVDFIRDGICGNGAARAGNSRWRRVTELRAGAAKSVFHFDCQGSVAKSTHAGIPWLRFLRRHLKGRAHFWPFDGWRVPPRQSAIVEVYPSLWSRSYPRDARDPHQHDAYSAACWMQNADRDGRLAAFLEPSLSADVSGTARVEGWILGVV